MKYFLTVSILFSVGSLLAQPSTGGGSSGAAGVSGSGGSSKPAATSGSASQGAAGVSGSGSALQQPIGGTTPAVGSPVQTAPATVSPLTTSPAGQTPAEQTPAGVTQQPGQGTDLDLVPAPQGIPPLDPLVTPPTNAPAGAITNLLPQDLNQNRINEPAGATPNQGSIDDGAVSQSSLAASPLNATDAFAQQVQAATAANGNTQVAFPAQNALVTIVSQNGALTLRGTVSNEGQRQSIEEAVRGISAGTFIDNQIEVSGNGTSTIVP